MYTILHTIYYNTLYTTHYTYNLALERLKQCLGQGACRLDLFGGPVLVRAVIIVIYEMYKYIHVYRRISILIHIDKHCMYIFSAQ